MTKPIGTITKVIGAASLLGDMHCSQLFQINGATSESVRCEIDSNHRRRLGFCGS
jgi:hypothetical protein